MMTYLNGARDVGSSVFSQTYAAARDKLRAAVPIDKQYLCSCQGPAGELLSTDVVYLGDPNAKNLLVLVSATHGAEGYCGSAAQLLFLQAGRANCLPADTGVLVIHALNSYGFAWDRRVTAEGCDLNRNFVDFSQPLPANPGYEELAEQFVPSDISPEAVARAEELVGRYGAAHGEHALRRARGGGQYTHPGGLFYGGTSATEARQILEQIAGDFRIHSRDRVIIIDYHTGLGPYGYGELQCEEVSGIDGYERAKMIFGPSVTSPVVGTSSATTLHGTQDEFWERYLGDRHTYVCLEFGTYAGGARDIMRRDHWLFKYRPEAAKSELGISIRKATKAYFYPQRADWMEMVVCRAHMVHRQALQALDE